MKVWRCMNCGSLQEIQRRPKACTDESCEGVDFHSVYTLPGIEAIDFAHSLDRDALKFLKAIPFFPDFLRWVNGCFLDRLVELDRAAADYFVTEENDSKLFSKFQLALKVLDIDQPINLYISQNPNLMSYVGGVRDTFVVISAGAVGMLNDDELLFLLGHELGHIKVEHVLFHSVARNLLSLLDYLGPLRFIGQFGLMTVFLGLYDWYRKSELTADRAGALCIQNSNVPIDVMIKLAGRTTASTQEDRDSFLAQSDH